MSDLKARRKEVEYDTLIATVNYTKHSMLLTNKATVETITIPAAAYAELQAILSDIFLIQPIDASNGEIFVIMDKSTGAEIQLNRSQLINMNHAIITLLN